MPAQSDLIYIGKHHSTKTYERIRSTTTYVATYFLQLLDLCPVKKPGKPCKSKMKTAILLHFPSEFNPTKHGPEQIEMSHDHEG